MAFPSEVRRWQIGLSTISRDCTLGGQLLSFFLLVIMLVALPRDGFSGGLRLAHVYPSDSSLGVWAQAFAQRVDEEIGIYIEVFGEGALGDSRELVDAVAAGYVDAALLPVSAVAQAVPDFAVLELPALFASDAGRERILDSGQLVAVLDEAARERGLALVAIGWSFGALSGATSELNQLQDLKGKKIRVARQWDARYLQAVGAAPVMLPQSEIYSALQVGVLDATLTGIQATGRLVQHGAVESIIWSDDFAPFLYASVLVVSGDVGFSYGVELIDQMRTIGVRTAREFHNMEFSEAQAVISAARDAGITIENVPIEDVEFLRKEAHPIWEEFASKVPRGNELVAIALAEID